MVYKKIALDHVKGSFFQFLSDDLSKSKDDFQLVPEQILRLAKKNKFKIENNYIPDWHKFEYGHLSWGEHMLFHTIFKDIDYMRMKDCILVTDPCFSLQYAFSIPASYLWDFAQNDYVDLTGDDFVEPQDYLLLFPDEKLLIIIHHEGQRILISK